MMLIIDVSTRIEASELVGRRGKARQRVHGAIEHAAGVRTDISVVLHIGKAVILSRGRQRSMRGRGAVVAGRLVLHVGSGRWLGLGGSLGRSALTARSLGSLRLRVLGDGGLLRGAVGGSLVEAELLFDLTEANLPRESSVSYSSRKSHLFRLGCE